MEAQYSDMGNSIREKHKARKGDFVLFADDDNWYFPPLRCTVSEAQTKEPLVKFSLALTQHFILPIT